jgi:hypothetical protein
MYHQIVCNFGLNWHGCFLGQGFTMDDRWTTSVQRGPYIEGQTTYWLIDWCLTPTLAIFHLYRGVNKLYVQNKYDIQWSAKHYTENENWTRRTPPKTGGELGTPEVVNILD